jgi:hypothetical protein
MEDFERTFNLLIESIHLKCPHFCPSLFPSKYSPEDFLQLFSRETIVELSTEVIITWMKNVNPSDLHPIFDTKVKLNDRIVEITKIKVIYFLFFDSNYCI